MRLMGGTQGIALLVALVAGLTGTMDSRPSAASAVQQDLPSQESITADPAAKLRIDKVAVTTIPAPVNKAVQAPAQAQSGASGYAWINATMAKYGVYPEAGTKFVIGPMPAGCYGADGCTMFSYYPSTGVAFDYTITLVPGQLTEYLLFHEIGHARGIRDECGADNFARSVLGPVPGHYC